MRKVKMLYTISLYIFVRDYHSGQFSRGYKLLCMLRKRIIRHGFNPSYLSENLYRNNSFYKEFESRYQDQV